MKKIVENYRPVTDLPTLKHQPMGDSASPKAMIFHILKDNAQSVSVLDIGFGTGNLGRLIKSNPESTHWTIDGIEGWEANCLNKELIDQKIYRNIWHGLAQELPSEALSKYNIICLLDVIEHLNAETAKWLLRTLLTNMGDDSFLFISTPLWYYPQDQHQDGDLEEHLIGVPASSMMALIPELYSISHPLVGGFIYSKKSLQFVEFFQPTSNKSFSYEMGTSILKAMNIPSEAGIVYRL